MNDQDSHYLMTCLEVLIDMLYNIEVKFKDGTITQFDRRSRFKPDNVDRLHDRIYYDMRDYGRIKSITSIPVI